MMVCISSINRMTSSASVDFLDDVLEAILELTAILGPATRPETSSVRDVLVQKVLGYVAICNQLGQALGDGGLADTGLANEKRIVLGAARKDLHHTLDFLFATDHGVELTVARFLRKIGGELLERVGAAPLLLRGVRAARRTAPGRPAPAPASGRFLS